VKTLIVGGLYFAHKILCFDIKRKIGALSIIRSASNFRDYL